MSPGRFRVARWLIRCYPARWRARYADEVLALIDDAGMSMFGLVDLARGALGERAREACSRVAGTPSASTVLIWRQVGFVGGWIACGLVLHSAATAAGSGLADLGVSVPVSWGPALRLLVAAAEVRIFIGVVFRLRSAQTGVWPLEGVGHAEAALWAFSLSALVAVEAAGGHQSLGFLFLDIDPMTRLDAAVFFGWIGLASRRRIVDERRLQEILARPGPKSPVYTRPILGLSEPPDARG